MIARPSPPVRLLVAVGVLGALAGCTGNTAAPAVATSPGAGQLLSDSGDGPDTTESFAASAGWDVRYSYDCSGARSASGFRLLVQRADRPVNTIADNPPTEGASGDRVARWPHGGDYSLKIETSCAWKLEVVQG